MKRIKLKKSLSLVMAAVLAAGGCVFSVPEITVSAASGNCGDNTHWEYANGTLTLSGQGEVSIIGWTKYMDEMTRVVVENGVTSLPTSAFYAFDNLESVTMADSVTKIGESLCAYCNKLTTVHLSDGLTDLPKDTFINCVLLSEWNFPKNIESIGERAFYCCVSIKDLSMPSTLRSIGARAFSGNNAKTLTLNDGLKSIGSNAFSFSCFPSVTIPKSVTDIGSQAFTSCYSSVRYNSSTSSIRGNYIDSLKGVVIYGYEGSAAQSFASKEGLTFVDIGEAGEHICVGKEIIDVQPTCTEEGHSHFECTICGKTVEETLDPLGHDIGDWIVTKEPTCETSGSRSKKCSRCSYEMTETLNALGHLYGEWYTDVAATVSSPGREICICNQCGATQVRETPKLEGYTIQASAGEGGSITNAGSMKMEKGSSVTYEIVPNDGYQVEQLLIDGVNFGGHSSYTFTNLSSDHTIRAVFSKIQKTVIVCNAIDVKSDKTCWISSETAFKMRDFTITATIITDGIAKRVDITNECTAQSSPQKIRADGKFGTVQVNFDYRGGDSAVQEYFRNYGIFTEIFLIDMGDGETDGKVDEQDAIAALKIYAAALVEDRAPYNDIQRLVLDVDQNGEVDCADACSILCYYAKKMLELPVDWDDV